jgi:hypothetical protein
VDSHKRGDGGRSSSLLLCVQARAGLELRRVRLHDQLLRQFLPPTLPPKLAPLYPSSPSLPPSLLGVVGGTFGAEGNVSQKEKVAESVFLWKQNLSAIFRDVIGLENAFQP